MTVISKMIKGVTLKVRSVGSHGCCGTQSVQDFSVRGDDSKLSKDELQYLYVDLYRKLRASNSLIFTAADADKEINGWSGGTGDSGRGAMASLMGFCQAVGFEEVGRGINPNNSHEIVIFMDAWLIGNKKTRELPEYPDIELPEPPKITADINSLADAIIAQLGA